jgi:hypothetical protein
MTRQQEIPDASGTIALDGEESLVDVYQYKESFLKVLSDEVGDLKDRLRMSAKRALGAAKGKAVRVFMRGTLGGVQVTAYDLSKDSNRPVLSEKKMAELTKAGGTEAIGLGPEELFEEERTPGGEVIELRGRWVQWFVEKVQADMENDPDITWEKREPVVVRRLAEAAIPKLELAADAGNKVAQMLLEMGIKAMMVKVER